MAVGKRSGIRRDGGIASRAWAPGRARLRPGRVGRRLHFTLLSLAAGHSPIPAVIVATGSGPRCFTRPGLSPIASPYRAASFSASRITPTSGCAAVIPFGCVMVDGDPAFRHSRRARSAKIDSVRVPADRLREKIRVLVVADGARSPCPRRTRRRAKPVRTPHDALPPFASKPVRAEVGAVWMDTAVVDRDAPLLMS